METRRWQWQLMVMGGSDYGKRKTVTMGKDMVAQNSNGVPSTLGERR